MEGYKFLEVSFKKDICPGFVYNILLTLVKLEIPDDAMIVYPVDKKYLNKDSGIEFNDSFCYEEFKKSDYVKSLKCRCNKAKIVEVIDYFLINYHDYGNMLQKVTDNFHGINPKDLVFMSTFDSEFIYPFNEYVKPNALDVNILRECGKGIHFLQNTIRCEIIYATTRLCI